MKWMKHRLKIIWSGFDSKHMACLAPEGFPHALSELCDPAHLGAVLGFGHHLQQLHDWLGLGHQRRDGVDDGGELLRSTEA